MNLYNIVLDKTSSLFSFLEDSFFFIMVKFCLKCKRCQDLKLNVMCG
jgi:hypothetical protein